MRVRLKGINRVSKKLADGSRCTYYYAWKGGPRLQGQPGTPEFHASYNAAVAARRVAPEGQLQTVLDKFERSTAFLDLAEKTRKDYKKHIKAIEAEYGDFPIAALQERGTRGEFLAWRDRIAANSRRQADYRFSVLARILSWGFDRGLVPLNPCERPGRLYRSGRADKTWTDADVAAFHAKAPSHLHLALTLALWTGQRQGDLLRLTWSAYDGTYIRITQGKTGVRVVIPAGAPLREALDAAKAKLTQPDEKGSKPRALTILATEGGTSWTESGFRASWRKACEKAGVTGVTFHDLRGTAVTRLAIAGCTVPEIASLTGHSMKDAETIVAHYMSRNQALAESAIRKLEGR
jgi:integrase